MSAFTFGTKIVGANEINAIVSDISENKGYSSDNADEIYSKESLADKTNFFPDRIALHTQKKDENVFIGNRLNCRSEKCGINGKCGIDDFVESNFSCADTDTMDSGSTTSSSIKTFFKPIASFLECGVPEEAEESVDTYDAGIAIMSNDSPSLASLLKLRVSDQAFIRRSNGKWTLSSVIDVTKDSITFLVDDFGNEKTVTKHRWFSSIRLVQTIGSTIENRESPNQRNTPGVTSPSEKTRVISPSRKTLLREVIAKKTNVLMSRGRKRDNLK